MIVCVLMIMVRDEWFINKQTIISHHQQTNNHLSPLPSTNKKSSLTLTIHKQTIISHHYHQQTVIMVIDDCLFVDGSVER
jgi:hypothetical protein